MKKIEKIYYELCSSCLPHCTLLLKSLSEFCSYDRQVSRQVTPL